MLQATPTLWQALASHVGEAGGGAALAGLRMLVGGEALTAALSAGGARAGGAA